MSSVFKYELVDWIVEEKLNWEHLSGNPYAIEMLEKNQEKINWKSLSSNPYAVHLLEKNQEKIDYNYLCRNINGIHLYKSLTSYTSKTFLSTDLFRARYGGFVMMNLFV